MRSAALLVLLALSVSAEASWLRGNLHTHTSESDGDSRPEEVAAWYAEHGYDFLVITDHGIVTRTEGNLLLIHGEEITDFLPRKPLHVNALGIETAIERQSGGRPADVLQHNIDAVLAAGGIPLVNHPNFGWAFGTAELLKLRGEFLLEIASGHPYVNMLGPPSVESMWDELLTAGRRVWGVAVDDSHHLKRPWDVDIAPPGDAWVVVRAACDQSSVLDALRRGDFYASTGVELVDYSVSGGEMRVTVRPKNGARYRTQFIGPAGRVLAEVSGIHAHFPLADAPAYVRAKVIDSNGRVAWLQPWFAR